KREFCLPTKPPPDHRTHCKIVQWAHPSLSCSAAHCTCTASGNWGTFASGGDSSMFLLLHQIQLLNSLASNVMKITHSGHRCNHLLLGARNRGRSACQLVEYHHLGDEGLDVSYARQTATCSERAKVLVGVAHIIGFVIILRKE